MYFNTTTPKGEYWCVVEPEKIALLMGKYNYAAKVTRIFFQAVGKDKPDDLPVALGDGLHESYGATYDEAKMKAGQEFQVWARRQGGAAEV